MTKKINNLSWLGNRRQKSTRQLCIYIFCIYIFVQMCVIVPKTGRLLLFQLLTTKRQQKTQKNNKTSKTNNKTTWHALLTFLHRDTDTQEYLQCFLPSYNQQRNNNSKLKTVSFGHESKSLCIYFIFMIIDIYITFYSVLYTQSNEMEESTQGN